MVDRLLPVDADARAADHPERVGALDQLGVQLRRRADQDAVVAGVVLDPPWPVVRFVYQVAARASA